MFENIVYCIDAFGKWAAELRDEELGLVYRVEFNHLGGQWSSFSPSVQILSRIYTYRKHRSVMLSQCLRATQHSAPYKDEAHH